jgi:hypothetical protein
MADDNTEAAGASREDTSVENSSTEDIRPEASGPKVIAGTVLPEDTGQADGSDKSTGYDETAGITYEVQPRGFEIPGFRSAGDEKAEPEAASRKETASRESGAAGAQPAGQEPAAVGPQDPEAQIPEARSPDREATEPEASAPSVVPPEVETEAERPIWEQTTAAPPQPDDPSGQDADRPGRGLLDVFFAGKKNADAAPAGGDDGPPPLTRVRDLPLDQKMRLWRMRALIVVIVGVVFAIIVNWEVGLTLAIVAGIVDTIYRSRTVESHAWAQPGTVDRATWRAQKRTIKQLGTMHRSGYLALHRRPIPGSVEVIDHLVVGPTGVYAIDSEKWDKELPIRQSNGKQLWLGPESKKDRLDHARWEAEQASKRLSDKLGMEVEVQPALAIYGPKISWIVLAVRGVDVFSGDELRKYIRRRARRKTVPHLSHDDIRKIYSAAAEVLPVEWQKSGTPVG